MVTAHYLVVEGLLARTGRELLMRHVDAATALTAFRGGLVSIGHDQRRHLEFAVRALDRLRRQDPSVPPTVRDVLMEVLPYAANVPRILADDERCIAALGEPSESILLGGFTRLEGYLGAAGFTVCGHGGVLPFVDPALPPDERARRPFVLARAGFFSDGTEPLRADHEAMRYHFDAVATTVAPCDGICDPMTIQWVFSDAEPWFLRIERDRAGAHPGQADAPDLTVESSLAAWLAVTGGRERFEDALNAKRLQVSGAESALLAIPRLFPTA
jgi:hypothetical protein